MLFGLRAQGSHSSLEPGSASPSGSGGDVGREEREKGRGWRGNEKGTLVPRGVTDYLDGTYPLHGQCNFSTSCSRVSR